MADGRSCSETESNVEDVQESLPQTDEDFLFEAVRNGNISEVSRLSSLWNIKIDKTDKSGMTALMHAAYKGDADSVDILITHGADVNQKSIEHEYTPLMFAVLAGSKECTKVLLEAGADPGAENKLSKTAGQMGAFVGRHECVSLINNYVGKEDIEYYTKPQGLETEPKLLPFLAEPLQNYVIITNLHPVYLCLYLNDNIALVENGKQVARVLEIKRDRLFKREINEIMAIKLHFLNCVHDACVKWHPKDNGIYSLIKRFLRGRPLDGFPLDMEDFIRNSIRSFPFRESNLFKHLIRTLAPVERGNEPTALTALTQIVNGFQSANFSDSCYTCGKRQSKKKCANCRVAIYCSQECQKLQWFTHKKNCKQLAIRLEQELILQKELEEQEAKARQLAEKEGKTDDDADTEKEAKTDKEANAETEANGIEASKIGDAEASGKKADEAGSEKGEERVDKKMESLKLDGPKEETVAE